MPLNIWTLQKKNPYVSIDVKLQVMTIAIINDRRYGIGIDKRIRIEYLKCF